MHKNRSGFTIVELLVVIMVIGILAAITVVGYNGVQSRARDAKRVSDVELIANGLQLWAINSGKEFYTNNAGAYGQLFGHITAVSPSTNYTALSIKQFLIQNGLLNNGVQEPSYVYLNSDYAVTLCVDNGADSRRIVMARLEKAPSKTISEQLSGNNCSGFWFNYWQGSPFNMNYAQLVDSKA